MLSKSCIRLVEMSFANHPEVKVKKVVLGGVELELNKNIGDAWFEKHFDKIGFEIVRDPDSELVERIKLSTVELIHYAFNANSLIRNSDYISEKVQMPYDKLSKTFSKVTGITLEKYIILVKIEKIKELISMDEYTLSEISYMMGYSSVQYLSNQFKKIAGITVSDFKDNPAAYRKSLEELI